MQLVNNIVHLKNVKSNPNCTFSRGLTIQVGDEFLPHLLVSSKSVCVEGQGSKEHVVKVAGSFHQTFKAFRYHRILKEQTEDLKKKKEECGTLPLDTAEFLGIH